MAPRSAARSLHTSELPLGIDDRVGDKGVVFTAHRIVDKIRLALARRKPISQLRESAVANFRRFGCVGEYSWRSFSFSSPSPMPPPNARAGTFRHESRATARLMVGTSAVVGALTDRRRVASALTRVYRMMSGIFVSPWVLGLRA